MTTKTLTPIELLDNLIAAGEDCYELAVAIGQDTEQSLTTLRWIQGDIVTRVHGAYGDAIVPKYAAALNVATSTLKQRRMMSNFYPKDTRVSFSSLGYSHYRSALVLGNLERAMWALEKCETKGWPVFKFEQLLKRLLGKGRGTQDSWEAKIIAIDMDFDSTVRVKLEIHEKALFKLGQRVTIRLK